MNAESGHELFRQQVLLLRHDNQERGTVIARPATLMGFSLMAGLLFLLLLYLLLMTRYKETIQARGIVEASGVNQTITAPADMWVQEILVEQGQRVRQGQALAVLSRRLYDRQGQPVSQLEVEQLEQQQQLLIRELDLTESVKAAELRQLHSLLGGQRENLVSLSRERQLLQQQLQISGSQMTGLAALLAESSISRADYQRQHLGHLDMQRQYQALTRRIGQLEQDIESHEQRLEALKAESELRLIQGQRKLEQLNFRRSRLQQQEGMTLVAELDGTVAGITVAAGDVVRARQPVMRIQDSQTSLQVVAYVPSRVIGKLVPGQELLLSFDAFNHLHYGRYPARIEQISRLPIDPRQQLIPVPGVNEPVFKLTARLDQHFVEGPDIYPLQPGLLLSADFIMAERTLFSFILRPVLELRGKVG